ncbi:MAG: hypothetical protein RJB38_1793 [Pseudomonadota bacterium]|jgi:uncharacterized membrane protein (UPF0127 family)
MASAKIVSLKNQRVISDQCVVADRFLVRLKGLIGRVSMSQSEAMWFPNCSSVHTWWMQMAIDVIFLRSISGDARGVFQVVAIHSGVRPWRLLPLWSPRATDTLELAPGVIQLMDLRPGDEVQCIV